MGSWLALAMLLGSIVPAHGTVTHRQLIVEQEYVPSGTASGWPAKGSVGLYGAGLGYPVVRGDRIVFTNLDDVPHTVTACSRCDPLPEPSGRFTSPRLTFAQSWELDTAPLPPGTYTYYCIHHFTTMRGSFVVAPV